MKKFIIIGAMLTATVASGCAKNAGDRNDTKEDVVSAQTIAPTISTDNPKSIVRTVDAALNGEEAFEAIKKNYEGEVVVVDFWATWCRPCCMAMKMIDEIKPGLMERGAKFVYITGETSPLEKWTEMIGEIDGEHYRITQDQWQGLVKSLNIPGIPAYVIFGKEGEVSFSNLEDGGFPGNEIIQEEVDRALTK